MMMKLNYVALAGLLVGCSTLSSHLTASTSAPTVPTFGSKKEAVLPRAAGEDCLVQQVIYSQVSLGGGMWGDFEWVGESKGDVGYTQYASCPNKAKPTPALTD